MEWSSARSGATTEPKHSCGAAWAADNGDEPMNEWNIQSRAHACQSCGRPFADQQLYHTVLFDEKSQFRREDVCDPCWQTQFSQGATDRKGFVSYWQGVYEAPPPPTQDVIRKETAETLLRKLMASHDARHAAATYILAVMLERKRLLKVKEQIVRDGQRTFVYEHPKTGDLFTIPDPNLQLDQLEDVQRDVAALLEHGPDSSSAAPLAADASTAPADTAAPSPDLGPPPMQAEPASHEPAPKV